MDDLDIAAVSITTKRIAEETTLRLIITVHGVAPSDEDMAKVLQWIQRLYSYITVHQMAFGTIIVLPVHFDDPTALTRLFSALEDKRHVTRRYSIGTCIVAPGVAAMLARIVLTTYRTSGAIEIVTCVDDAKKFLRTEARKL